MPDAPWYDRLVQNCERCGSPTKEEKTRTVCTNNTCGAAAIHAPWTETVPEAYKEKLTPLPGAAVAVTVTDTVEATPSGGKAKGKASGKATAAADEPAAPTP